MTPQHVVAVMLNGGEAGWSVVGKLEANLIVRLREVVRYPLSGRHSEDQWRQGHPSPVAMAISEGNDEVDGGCL